MPKNQRSRSEPSTLQRLYICLQNSAYFQYLPTTFKNHLQDSQNVKGNALKIFKNTLSLSGCSPLLIIKRKLGLTHVSLNGLYAFDKAYSRTIHSLEMSCKNAESCRLDILTNEEIETNLRELDKEVSKQDDCKLITYSKQRKKNYEHPIQVQQYGYNKFLQRLR